MLYAPPRLRTLRVASGLSQRFVADEIGVSATSVRRWEQGDARVPAEHQDQLAEFFGVTVPWLMGESWDSLEPETMLDAIRTLRRLHADMVNLVMVTVDLVGVVQDGKDRVNMPNLRHAAANKFRRAFAAREGALTMLCGEVVA